MGQIESLLTPNALRRSTIPFEGDWPLMRSGRPGVCLSVETNDDRAF